MTTLIGHTDIQDYFKKVLAADAVSHAYCFVGPEHIGKRAMVEALAAELLGVPVEKLGTHPDMIVVAQEKHEKSGKTKKHISVAQINQLRSTLWQKPFLATRRVAIIDGAELMNQNASNALLKTLEEPAPGTHIFLLATDDAALPETIVSRCHVVPFTTVPVTELAAALKTGAVNEVQANELAQVSGGRPGLALAWQQDPSGLQERKDEVARFDALFGQAFYEKRASVKPLFGGKSDHIAQRQLIVAVLDLWRVRVRDAFVTETMFGPTPFASESVDLPALDATILQAQQQLRKNVHPQLALDHILLQIP